MPKGSDMLPDSMHRFETTLREPSRQLAIKDMVINFDPTTVYGNRTGFLRGMLATVTCPHRKPKTKGLMHPTDAEFRTHINHIALRQRAPREAIAFGSLLPGGGAP